MRLAVLLAGTALAWAVPATAQVRPVPVQPASEAAALRGVEVFLVNEGAAPVTADGPRQIEVTATDGTKLILERVPGPTPTVQPGGFAKTRYVPVGIAGAPPPPLTPRRPDYAGPEPSESETVADSATGTSAGFLSRFSAHEPIYGVFGSGDAGGKLQVSFAFQPFGGEGAASHLRFAWTQTMFWAIQEPSGPFRSTNYSPEIYVTAPIGEGLRLDLGYRHDSNGRGVADSVDANRIYARVAKSFQLGNGWRADIAPEAWFYVGEKGAAPDLPDYWGYTALTASIGQQDGIKVAITGRGSFTTGKGSAELFASYPLTRLGGLGIYLFGQAWTGYGEALDNLRVSDTHARLGIALTR